MEGAARRLRFRSRVAHRPGAALHPSTPTLLGVQGWKSPSGALLRACCPGAMLGVWSVSGGGRRWPGAEPGSGLQPLTFLSGFCGGAAIHDCLVGACSSKRRRSRAGSRPILLQPLTPPSGAISASQTSPSRPTALCLSLVADSWPKNLLSVSRPAAFWLPSRAVFLLAVGRQIQPWLSLLALPVSDRDSTSLLHGTESAAVEQLGAALADSVPVFLFWVW